MTLQARTQALLDLVESDRAQRRDALLSQAIERARALLEAANAQARERGSEAERRGGQAAELEKTAARDALPAHHLVEGLAHLRLLPRPPCGRVTGSIQDTLF